MDSHLFTAWWLVADLASADIPEPAAPILPMWAELIGLFALGSMLGSFANVVIWRLPRGESLLWPGSHCPRCSQAIAAYDNVPILSWLWLRGKCRRCRTAISARYPLVEALFGVLLAALGWLDLWWTPAAASWNGNTGNAEIPASQWLDAALVPYHLALCSSLICAALIERDRQPVPRRLWAFCLLLAFAVPLALPSLQPAFSGLSQPLGLAGLPRAENVFDALVGVAAGLLLAGLSWPASGLPGQTRPADGVAWAFIAVGACLGWPAACAVAAVAAIADLIWLAVRGTLGFRQRIGWATWIAAATPLWLFARPLVEHGLPQPPAARLMLLTAGSALVGFAAIASWRLASTASPRKSMVPETT